MKHIKKKQVVFSTLVALACLGHMGYASNTAATTTENGVTNNYWDITINNVSEDHGLELGTNTRARGNGSIATGKNSVAIGNNAVATGGNETKDSITSKLNENKQKLADIANAENKTKSLLNELQTIRKKEADVLEAGERVKQVQRAKATAYEQYQAAQKQYEEAKAGSADYLKAVQAKIDDLNSRLTGVSRIQGVNILSDEGLTNAATQFKSIVENGTTLNLEIGFYKNYISSYYKALGDIRADKKTYDRYETLSTNSNIVIDENNILDTYNQIHFDLDRFHSNLPNYALFDIPGYSRDGNKNILRLTSMSLGINDASIITKEEYTKDINLLESQKNKILSMFDKLPQNGQLNPFTQYKDLFSDNYIKKNKEGINHIYELKILEKKWGYYQWEYEQTHDTTWLDKKAATKIEFDKKFKNFMEEYESIPDLSECYRDNANKFYQTHVSDIKEKNKITTATLTSELEKALQINKNAALDKEKEIENLKKAAAQALATYNNTNPSDADIMMSQRYDAIMKELSTKANKLKSEQERLEALKKALTLHDLTNVGENAMAMGTHSLATGTDSLAIGTSSVATGNNAVAIGKNASVTSTNSAAIGVDHIITGDMSSTLGYKNTIYGTNSYAIGSMNTIGATSTKKGSNTFVLGNNVTTTANNAVVLGSDSTATEDNVVSIGANKKERKIIHVADGTLSESSTDAVNGKQLYNAMQNTGKANTALDNITNEGKTIIRNLSKEAVQLENGTNTTVESRVNGNSTIYKVNVSNDTITGVITPKLTELSNSVDTKLGTKANKDASNLSSDDVKTWSEKLGTGSISPENTGLVNGGTVHTAIKNAVTTATSTINNDIDIKLTGKANTSLDNITDEGKTIIRNLSKEAVQLENGTNTTVESRVNGNSTIYKVNVSNDTITGVITPKLTELSNSVDTKLGTKANKDASNLSADDVKTWNEKLGTGSAKAGDKGLITGDTLHTALANVQIDPATLTSKANTNASNLTDENVKEWTSKLGIGTVGQSNSSNGLVTGKAVYEAIQKHSPTGLVKTDGHTITVDKAGTASHIDLSGTDEYGNTILRDITGIVTNPNNPTSAVNMYTLQNQSQELDQKLTKSINVGIAAASALAALHPLDYDESNKISFAVSHGQYNGSKATAFGGFIRPNENIMLSLASTINSNDSAWNAGLSFKFGSGSSHKKTTTDEINELRKKNDTLQEQLNQLKNQLSKLSTKFSNKRTSFPDIPKNHWASKAVETLHGNDVLDGYPDGEFKGDKQLTRYEYAQMLYNYFKN